MSSFNFLRYQLAKRKVRQLLSSVDGLVDLNTSSGADNKEGWISIGKNSDHIIRSCKSGSRQI